ncbi:hypothetical protein CPT_Phriendly_058 [Vibrio phage Phriendly]|nr:hypothetical protein CPT_Phriendly_058 [Vibrio phage Phriendly]
METESSIKDETKVKQIQAILDSNVFIEALDDLRADALLKSMVADSDELSLQYRNEAKAVDALITQLEVNLGLYKGE